MADKKVEKDQIKRSMKKVVGGKLNLKGGAKGMAPTIDKAKNRPRKKLTEDQDDMSAQLKEYLERKEAQETDDADEAAAIPSAGDSRTKAERQYEEMQLAKERDLIKKKLSKTHRERIAEFNTYLGSLSEHHDIPRVGPG